MGCLMLVLLLRLFGRRVVGALILAVVAGIVMQALMTTGESATATPSPRPKQATMVPSPRPRPTTTTAKTTAAVPAPVPVAKPTTAAEQWYAARHKLPAGSVRAIQTDAVHRDTVRVLLVVTKANGRLDSAVVTVRHAKDRWVVVNR
jgi:uncharacterized membrane protein YraQ (UPF0718 family)